MTRNPNEVDRRVDKSGILVYFSVLSIQTKVGLLFQGKLSGYFGEAVNIIKHPASEYMVFEIGHNAAEEFLQTADQSMHHMHLARLIIEDRFLFET